MVFSFAFGVGASEYISDFRGYLLHIIKNLGSLLPPPQVFIVGEIPFAE